jgi:hypothetical protein
MTTAASPTMFPSIDPPELRSSADLSAALPPSYERWRKKFKLLRVVIGLQNFANLSLSS